MIDAKFVDPPCAGGVGEELFEGGVGDPGDWIGRIVFDIFFVEFSGAVEFAELKWELGWVRERVMVRKRVGDGV